MADFSGLDPASVSRILTGRPVLSIKMGGAERYSLAFGRLVRPQQRDRHVVSPAPGTCESKSADIDGASGKAVFGMRALQNVDVDRAWLQAPLTDLERFITDAMVKEAVTAERLERKRIINTPSAVLDWAYLQDVKKYPISWVADTYVIRGADDEVVPLSALSNLLAAAKVQIESVPARGHFWVASRTLMCLNDGWRRFMGSVVV